jgi:hypothetical protein
MYAVPAVLSFGLALSNYAQQSFGVYLKYQAMVDTYYLKHKANSSLHTIVDPQREIMEQLKSQEQISKSPLTPK